MGDRGCRRCWIGGDGPARGNQGAGVCGGSERPGWRTENGGAIGAWAVLATDVSARNTFQVDSKNGRRLLSRLLQRRRRGCGECSRSRGGGKGGGAAMGSRYYLSLESLAKARLNASVEPHGRATRL